MSYNKIIDSDLPPLEFYANQEAQHVEPAENFREETKAYLDAGVEQAGDALPWALLEERFRLRPGEVTIWAGINGHGKSQLLGQVIAWLLPNTKAMVASMEMKPVTSLARMVRQACRTNKPTDSRVDDFFNVTKEHLYIYSVVGTAKSDRVLAAVHYAATEKQVKHVVIDSLATCGIDTDDNNTQKSFMLELAAAAKRYDIHIHLVHHIRKGKTEGDIPDKFDVKGAGELVDLCDNLAIVFRNKKKENTPEDERDMQDYDGLLRIAKQRHGEWEGALRLWFDPRSLQYVTNQEARPMYWRGFGEEQ